MCLISILQNSFDNIIRPDLKSPTRPLHAHSARFCAGYLSGNRAICDGFDVQQETGTWRQERTVNNKKGWDVRRRGGKDLAQPLCGFWLSVLRASAQKCLPYPITSVVCVVKCSLTSHWPCRWYFFLRLSKALHSRKVTVAEHYSHATVCTFLRMVHRVSAAPSALGCECSLLL